MISEHSEQQIVPILVGGGTRLCAHIGVLEAIRKLGLNYSHLVGVSGGSIVASLYASGFSLDQIYRLAMQTDFSQFRGFSLWQLVKHGGLSSGDHFERWMDHQLQHKTFAELDFPLHIVATDVQSGEPVVMDAENTPGLNVARAVRFSMSIPLVFSVKEFQQHLMVDGCILGEDALFRDWSGEGSPAISFRLRSEQKKREKEVKSLLPLKDYVMLLIRAFMTALSREYINAKYWHHTVVVNTGSLSAVDFTMDQEKKDALYKLGYQTVLEHLPPKLSIPDDVSKLQQTQA